MLIGVKLSQNPFQTSFSARGWKRIAFSAKVGKQLFSCGKTYAGLGKSATTVTLTDFRFYVSDVALIDASGKVIPLNLTQDGKWQYQNVALLDFENKSGSCVNGTVEIRKQVIGTIPKGNYQGLQFTLGVPSNLNHSDSVTASSPLNLTSLWWNWRFGYKFARIDLGKPSFQSSADLLAFLRTLTDEKLLKNPAFSDPNSETGNLLTQK